MIIKEKISLDSLQKIIIVSLLLVLFGVSAAAFFALA